MNSSNDDLLARVLRRIPGFRGYVQQEDRRRSEEQTRRFVSDQLQQVKTVLMERARQLADQGRIGELGPIDDLQNRVESVRSQSDRPALGGRGIIGAPALDEDDLEDLYDLEANLMDRAAALHDASRQLDEPVEGLIGMWQTLEDKLSEVSGLVEQRKALLQRLLTD